MNSKCRRGVSGRCASAIIEYLFGVRSPSMCRLNIFMRDARPKNIVHHFYVSFIYKVEYVSRTAGCLNRTRTFAWHYDTLASFSSLTLALLRN